jgi:hypothetical protein
LNFAFSLIFSHLSCIDENIFLVLFHILKTKLKIDSAMKAEKMEKVVADVIDKLGKLKHKDLASDLSWCWVSFQSDQNPVGVVEKATQALAAFKEAREKNPKAVAKKMIEDLEKALA